MLAAVVVSVVGWVIGAPPAGSALVEAEEHDGVQQTYYWHATRDPDDAPLELYAYPPGAVPFPAPAAGGPTVHGVPAEFGVLHDDGEDYGRTLRWIEPSGFGLSVEFDGKPSDARLRGLAESVVSVPPERWQELLTSFSGTPEINELPAGTTSVRLRRGLEALVPAGFPVAPEDQREPCMRVSYRGKFAYSCGELPRWKRIGGALYVYGTLPPRARQVRVVGRGRVSVRDSAFRAPRYPLASFYAVRLPSRACVVRVIARGFLEDVSPASGGSVADRRRCGIHVPPA